MTNLFFSFINPRQQPRKEIELPGLIGMSDGELCIGDDGTDDEVTDLVEDVLMSLIVFLFHSLISDFVVSVNITNISQI